MLQAVYNERAGGGVWNRLLLSGRLGGYLNVGVGILLVCSILLPYLGGKSGLLTLTDAGSSAREQVRRPPDWKFLANWLDTRSEAEKALSTGRTGGFPFERKQDRAQEELFHPLGTDSAGRDLLQVVILAADNAFLPGLYSVVLAIGLGCVFGIFWGYYGGWRGSIVETIIKVTHSIPRLFLLLVIGAATNFDIYWIMTGLGIINFPKVAELIRSRILQLKRQEFITAAREVGMKDLGILTKHILWYNCRHILFIQASFGMADAVLTETTLSYLGFGAQGVSWGGMVSSGKNYLFDGQLWMSVVPASCVVIVILGFCLIGDGLSRIFKLKVN